MMSFQSFCLPNSFTSHWLGQSYRRSHLPKLPYSHNLFSDSCCVLVFICFIESLSFMVSTSYVLTPKLGTFLYYNHASFRTLKHMSNWSCHLSHHDCMCCWKQRKGSLFRVNLILIPPWSTSIVDPFPFILYTHIYTF